MLFLFHILVTPDPDEPLIVTDEQIDAGQEWLEVRVADGRLMQALPFPKTGGFVLVRVSAANEDQARARLDAMFADYPLLSTVHMEINLVLLTLKEGFDVLRAARQEGRRISEVTP